MWEGEREVVEVLEVEEKKEKEKEEVSHLSSVEARLLLPDTEP